ncbi:MAG: SBBP repeat-containing protein, partial [Thermoplasmata archaeon]|nr:SBBP repeat-containing protein [Thermoplasmata archaeon]
THDDYVTIKFDTYGNKLWENRYNGPGNGLDRPSSIDADLAGNVYVTGKSTGNSSAWDYATVAYDSMGKELWVARYNGLGNGIDHAEAISITPTGNIIVTGVSLGNGKKSDCTTIAYDWNGNELWIARYNDTRFENCGGYEIDIDVYGNIYVGGCGISKGFNYDYIIIKYDSKGNELWSKYYNGPGNGYDFLFDIKVNENGNVFVTGRSDGNGTSVDYATLKYNTNGICQWINRYNGPGNAIDLARGLDIDLKDNVYVTGYSDNGTNNDFATIAYNSSGKELWIARYDGSGNGHDNAYAIAVDSFSNVYVTGKSFGNGTYDDITTIAYNVKGERLWVEVYNGPSNRHDGCFAITTDLLENIYVAGYITDIGGSEYITIKYSTFKSYECDEGTSLTFKASGFDPGSDDLNFTWVWNDGTNKSPYIYYNNNKSQDPDPSPWGTYPFERTDLVSNTYGDDGVFLIRLYLSDDDGGLTTYKLRIIVNNIAPKIKEISPYTINEGESLNLSTFAVDPGSDDLQFNWSLENESNIINIHYNNGIGPDPYPSPKGTFPFSVNDSINYTFPDDGIYNITLTVTDDDGLNSSYKTKVIVKNIAPFVKLKASFKSVNTTAIMAVRIAGEKWHDVKVELYKNGKEVTNGSLIRYPGSPNDQMLHFPNQTIDSSSNWSAILYYTPNDDPVNGKPNGATPCWVILNLSNGKQLKSHHTFKVKHKKTHIWRVNLTEVLPTHGNSSRKGTFNITVFDPGSDNITLYLDFGDGTNITKFYPNNNQTFPVIINLTLSHDYTSGGTFSVILIAKDDDGGITTVKVNIKFG